MSLFRALENSTNYRAEEYERVGRNNQGLGMRLRPQSKEFSKVDRMNCVIKSCKRLKKKKDNRKKPYSETMRRTLVSFEENYFDSFRVIDDIQNFKRFSYNWMMKRKRQCENSAFEKFRNK